MNHTKPMLLSLNTHSTVGVQSYPAPQPASQSDSPLVLEGYLVLTVPILLILGSFGYRRYRLYVLRQQVAMLERLWQLTAKRRLNRD